MNLVLEQCEALGISRGGRTGQSCSISRTQGKLPQCETCKKNGGLLISNGKHSLVAPDYYFYFMTAFDLQGSSDGKLVLFGCSQVLFLSFFFLSFFMLLGVFFSFFLEFFMLLGGLSTLKLLMGWRY